MHDTCVRLVYLFPLLNVVVTCLKVTCISFTFSLVTMTVLLENPERRFKVKASVVNFILPILAMFVKNGSALYICGSVLYIGRSQGADISISSLIVMG